MSKKLLANVGNTVVDNYRRYYQEYEGTFITATDKSEYDTLDTNRYIEVTEIWGNTIQDENNLEDIQSVGELYVDDEGNPILDDLGREQYKIEIESCNKNLFQEELLVSKTYLERRTISFINDKVTVVNKVNYSYTNENHDMRIRLKAGNYTLNLLNVENPNNIYCQIALKLNNVDITSINTINNIKFVKFTIETDCEPTVYTNVLGANIGEVSFNVQIEEGSMATEYIPYQSYKTTILLPCQLQKVGDVYDRLYWDSEKEKYVVDKKVKNFKTNPQVIETNITEKIQLPCYSEKTHVFVNSTVDATMKVLVPYKEII